MYLKYVKFGFISLISKSRFLKFSSLLMALSIFIISCDVSNFNANDIKTKTNDQLQLLSSQNQADLVKELTNVYYNYINDHPESNDLNRINFLNDYVISNYGAENGGDIQEAVNILNNTSFQADGNSLYMYFKLLYSDNQITENELNYFLQFDNSLKNVGDFATADGIINNLLTTINNDNNLTSNETARLQTFSNGLLFLYQSFNNDELVSRDLCSQCMYDHRFEILAISASALTFWIACMVSTSGFGSIWCTAIAAAIIATGTAAIMSAECYEECFGEHCDNPDCPLDMPPNHLGNFCCYDVLLENPAVWKGGYYYDPIDGDCIYGLAIPVGDVCYYGPVPKGYGEGVVIKGKICVQSKCLD